MKPVNRSTAVSSSYRRTTGNAGRRQRLQQPVSQGSSVDRHPSDPAIIRNKQALGLFYKFFEPWFGTPPDTVCIDWPHTNALFQWVSACLLPRGKWWILDEQVCVQPPNQLPVDLRGLKLCIQRTTSLFNRGNERVCLWFKKNYSFSQPKNKVCVDRTRRTTLFEPRFSRLICVAPKRWYGLETWNKICLEPKWWWGKN